MLPPQRPPLPPQETLLDRLAGRPPLDSCLARLPELEQLGDHQRDVLRASLERSLSGRKRLRVALQLVDEFGAAIASATACRRGCSHCCYIRVEMTELEAVELGAAIGRAPDRQGGNAPDDADAYGYDTPCPFLLADLRHLRAPAVRMPQAPQPRQRCALLPTRRAARVRLHRAQR